MNHKESIFEKWVRPAILLLALVSILFSSSELKCRVSIHIDDVETSSQAEEIASDA